MNNSVAILKESVDVEPQNIPATRSHIAQNLQLLPQCIYVYMFTYIYIYIYNHIYVYIYDYIYIKVVSERGKSIGCETKLKSSSNDRFRSVYMAIQREFAVGVQIGWVMVEAL